MIKVKPTRTLRRPRTYHLLRLDSSNRQGVVRLMRFRAVLILLLTSTFTAAQDVKSDMLVSTAWLADHLNDPRVIVLEVDHDMGSMDMGKAKHIPGARRADLNQIQVKRAGLNTELPP